MEDGAFLSLLTGSFSSPAGDNPTVAMIEAAYRHLDLNARYLNCDVRSEDLGDAVRGARAMGWLGFNCSLPHKVAVIRHLDELAPSARIIGAVNCVVVRGDRLSGENTDGKGFLRSLATVMEPAGTSVALLGAGGAARAIAVELALAGARAITVVNRDRQRGESLVALLNERTSTQAVFSPWSGNYAVCRETNIVINATSIGLAPRGDDCPAIDVESLLPAMVVADVIPNPPWTVLLQRAAARGCRTLDGLGMLVNQGVAGIELWTGRIADSAVMHQAIEQIRGD